MTKLHWALFAVCLGGLSCSGSSPSDDIFTPEERAKFATLSPLPALPPDTTNAVADNPDAAVLGQRFFFETGYSGALIVGNDGQNGAVGAVGETGKLSCASCHDATHWFSDTRSNPNGTALGADWGGRNSPSLVNAAFYTSWHWDGRFDSEWSEGLGGIENPKSLHSDRLTLAHFLYSKYKDQYDAVFPSAPLDPALDPAAPDASRFPPSGKPKANASDPDGPWEGMTAADQMAVNRIFTNFVKCIGAYMRLLVSRNAPFDKFVAGDASAISASAQRGLKLFLGKAACVQCHTGPNFSDEKFHVTGITQQGLPHAPATDDGRFVAVGQLLASPFNSDGNYSDDTSTGRLTGLEQDPAEHGQFRTKDLRQVAETGPYMHAGQLATLQDVIDFYNRGGDPSGFSGTLDPLIKPLNLTTSEESDLIEFLKTLTGDPIPAALQQDTH